DGRHARLAAHSGLTAAGPEIAPPVIPLADVGDSGMWDVARVVRLQVAAESHGMRERLVRHLRDPSFAPHLVASVPLDDPGGGVGGVLVMGTNPMRPPEDGRKL